MSSDEKRLCYYPKKRTCNTCRRWDDGICRRNPGDGYCPAYEARTLCYNCVHAYFHPLSFNVCCMIKTAELSIHAVIMDCPCCDYYQRKS